MGILKLALNPNCGTGIISLSSPRSKRTTHRLPSLANRLANMPPAHPPPTTINSGSHVSSSKDVTAADLDQRRLNESKPGKSFGVDSVTMVVVLKERQLSTRSSVVKPRSYPDFWELDFAVRKGKDFLSREELKVQLLCTTTLNLWKVLEKLLVGIGCWGVCSSPGNTCKFVGEHS